MGKVIVHAGDKTVKLDALEESNLLRLLNKNGFNISNPCGGKGTCGKCKIKVEGADFDISQKERKLLGEKSILDGYRLACYLKTTDNMNIYLKENKQKAVVVTDAVAEKTALKPYVIKKYIKIKKTKDSSPKSDAERILKSVKCDDDYLNLNILKKLPDIFSNCTSGVTLVYYMDKLIDVEPGNTMGALYGIGIDIGTTTVAAYLVNLNSGKTVGVYSSLNPQKAFGDDVISRINYTMENSDGVNELRKSIITCINTAAETLVRDAGIENSQVYSMNIAGNTTMLHMVMGIECRKLALSPFIPVTTLLHTYSANELSIDINPYGRINLLPGISAYVGADTICAVLASNMHKSTETALLVDIGTNGEIVLGSKKGMYSCSVAAGPAFEGAHLKNGIGGVTGAIDKVVLTKGIEYTTIGSGSPLGICGSGIVDAIAQLLDKGIIDATGRFLEDDELPTGLGSEFTQRITEVDGMKAFALYFSNDADKNIYVTQKDIREIQNAKAAIAAGIKTLIKKAEIEIEAIDKVYLAGGFGSFINIESAVKIGLLPKELYGRIVAIGNAAGAGAIQTLISSDCFRELAKIKKKIRYIELSGNNDFTDLYIGCMMLE